MHDLPKTVILGLEREFQDFVYAMSPLISRNRTTPSDLVENLWEGFFSKQDRGEQIDAAVSDSAFSPVFNHLNDRSAVAEALFTMADSIANIVDSHALYFGRTYLPFNLVVKRGVLVLQRDDKLDQVQQSGGGDG